jgi:Zn-dependent protease
MLESFMDLRGILFRAIAITIALTVHEGSHALAATVLGDDTPKRYGRLTLNPFKHVHPIMLLMFALIGFGWASTPVNPAKMRGDPRIAFAGVSAAGPISNLLVALLCAGLLQARLGLPDPVPQLILVCLFLNVTLFVLNLLPIPPLDGFSVALGLLPRESAAQLKRIEPYGPGILMVLFMLPFIVGIDILGRVINPVVNLIFRMMGFPI